MVAGSSLWMRRQAGLPRTWRPVRPEAARGACGQAQGATPQAAASWAWKRLRSGQGPPEGLTGHTVPAVVAGRTECGPCLHRRRQPGAPGGVQPRPSDSGLTGCGCPVTRSLVGCYGRRTPTHDGEAACARTRARWEGRRAGGMEPCPVGALPALLLPRRVQAGRWLGAWTGRAGALTSRRGEVAWGQPVWLDGLPSSARAPLPAVDRNQAEAEQGPSLGCLWWTVGEKKERRHPRRKSRPLYLTGKASLHSANASLVMCWLQRP